MQYYPKQMEAGRAFAAITGIADYCKSVVVEPLTRIQALAVLEMAYTVTEIQEDFHPQPDTTPIAPFTTRTVPAQMPRPPIRSLDTQCKG